MNYDYCANPHCMYVYFQLISIENSISVRRIKKFLLFFSRVPMKKACKDKLSKKKCEKLKKKNKGKGCKKKGTQKKCKATCELCDGDTDGKLHNYNCIGFSKSKILFATSRLCVHLSVVRTLCVLAGESQDVTNKSCSICLRSWPPGSRVLPNLECTRALGTF